jgi:hypothetical protein
MTQYQSASPLTIFLIGGLPILFFGFLILSTIFWIMTLIDCAVNEPSEGNDKIIWILILIFTHALGALIYRCARRPERIRLYGK